MTPWRLRAACRDTNPDLFFSDDVTIQARAKQVCAGCPVAADCLAAALEAGEEFGVQGGYTARERWRLQRGLAPVVAMGRPPKTSSVRPCGARRCAHEECQCAAAAYQREYYHRVRKYTRLGLVPPS